MAAQPVVIVTQQFLPPTRTLTQTHMHSASDDQQFRLLLTGHTHTYMHIHTHTEHQTRDAPIWFSLSWYRLWYLKDGLIPILAPNCLCRLILDQASTSARLVVIWCSVLKGPWRINCNWLIAWKISDLAGRRSDGFLVSCQKFSSAVCSLISLLAAESLSSLLLWLKL